MTVRRLDHVGVVVDDLQAAVDFFLEVGLEREGSGSVSGEWVDRIVALDGVRSELVFLGAPDGSSKLELTKFHAPADDAGARPEPANRLGLRHLCFAVDDLSSTVQRLGNKGYGLVGEVGNYEDVFRLCYVRGPDGIIVELAEEITAQPGREGPVANGWLGRR